MVDREVQVMTALTEMDAGTREQILGVLSLDAEAQARIRDWASKRFGGSTPPRTKQVRRRGKGKKNKAPAETPALKKDGAERILKIASAKAEDGKVTRQAVQFSSECKDFLSEAHPGAESEAFKAYVNSLVESGKLSIDGHTWSV